MKRLQRLASNFRQIRLAFLPIVCLLTLLSTPLDGFGHGSAKLADLAEKIKHSVVNLSATKMIDVGGPRAYMDKDNPLRDFLGDEFFNRFFGNMPHTERKANALGSGFIISSDGLIMTNYHVVSRAEEITVRLENGKEYDAKVVGSDSKTDLALIRIKPDKGFPDPVKLGDSQAMRVGEEVMAVGNPFGLGHTVTAGIISATDRVIGAGPYDDFLQTDAAINPGNSGGPLVNMAGEVIGLNTAIVAQGQGIGFAIPINLVAELLPQLKSGKVVRGWLGVVIQNVTQPLADAFNLKNTEGILVSDVTKDSPAASAGIERGDVITGFNGQDVKDAHELSRMVASTKPGTVITLMVTREGKTRKIPVTLGTLEESPAEVKQPAQETQPEATWGMAVQTLTPELARRLGLNPDEKGVLVVQVEPDSPASKAGVKEGDVIKEVNRQAVENSGDFKQQTLEKKNGNLLLLVQRGEGSTYLVLKKE